MSDRISFDELVEACKIMDDHSIRHDAKVRMPNSKQVEEIFEKHGDMNEYTIKLEDGSTYNYFANNIDEAISEAPDDAISISRLIKNASQS